MHKINEHSMFAKNVLFLNEISLYSNFAQNTDFDKQKHAIHFKSLKNGHCVKAELAHFSEMFVMQS